MLRVAALVEKPSVHAWMQSLNSSVEHFWKCGEARDLAHGNLLLPQQVRCSTSGNDVHALTLEDARERSHAGFVGNRNQSASDFHRKNYKSYNSYKSYKVNRERLQRCNSFNVCNEIASAIKNHVLRSWIKHRAAADGFAESFAKMTQARISHFCGRFGDVVTSRAQ